jgi:hypothetical protein
VTRCHVCGRRCVYEVEPACGTLPAVTEPDVWCIVLRNRLIVDACQSCWQLWPDDWKHFPDRGFGRWTLTTDELVELLRETAP